MALPAGALVLGAFGGGDGVQTIERAAPKRMPITGNGLPADAQGRNGDLHIDLTTTTLCGPKGSGTWPGTGVSLIVVRGRPVRGCSRCARTSPTTSATAMAPAT